MSEWLEVCPDCETSAIMRRRGGNLRGSQPADGKEWRCTICGHTFDEPAERERESHGNRPPVGGQALLDADPDELLSDGGVDTASGFVNLDADGDPYLVCVEWLVEDGIGSPCEGRMRPTDDGDRWQCPECGATSALPDAVRADGGDR